MTLRPYQHTMVADTRAAFRAGHRRVILQAPTGSGKTVVSAHIAQGAQAKGNRMLVLTHRREIQAQLLRAFKAADVRATMFPEASPCQIGTIGKVASRLDALSAPDFIFVDEFHHAVSATFQRVLNYFPTAKVLGLTATPQRLDGRGLSEVADQLVLGPSMKSLIRDGWLKQPVYYAPRELLDVSGLRKRGGDFRESDLETLMAKPGVTGNAVAEYQRLCPGRTALAFCVTVAHAEAVAALFNGAGIRAASVDGKLSKEQRDYRLQALSDGSIKVLTSCELISEGFDAPAVGAVISLRPTASLVLFMQQTGRGLRPALDKDCIVLDHAGNCFRHGFAEDDREWSLEGEPPRKKSAEPEGPEVHRCDACLAVFTGQACMQCGAARKPSVREIKQKEGELERLTEIQRKVNHRAEERACKTLDDWQALGKRRGYSPKWVFIRWKRSWRGKIKVDSNEGANTRKNGGYR